MQFADLRFTVSEVARLTRSNLNTVQSWRRKGFFKLDEGEGWYRYTPYEVYAVSVFAEVSRSSGNQNLASVASSSAVLFFSEIGEGSQPFEVFAWADDDDYLKDYTYGADDLGRIIRNLIANGSDAGAYVVVDYAAIYRRLINRLSECGYVWDTEVSA